MNAVGQQTKLPVSELAASSACRRWLSVDWVTDRPKLLSISCHRKQD